ncbi:MAG: SSU rRNA (adenine(1518)-N(6)/adenine(1519)-N(6))-dimethyltransferase [Candidatus Kapaibacterium sp.]|nr:MAG: SSU rRNA (adenine(1518)-N(6)/adenine(1519)-N(6))-dimethyltransferase [Candidatus Kapabacteria bacterium]
MTLPKVKPKKRFGQNFLVDNNIARKIVESLYISPESLVVEIGPGKGSLTKFLVDYPIYYFGFEIDEELTSYLDELKSKNKCIFFEILFKDFLEFKEKELCERFHQKIYLFGNIPYYLTSPILFKVLDNRQYYEKITLMVQREVANRIVAKPKTKDYGILSVLIQTFSNVKKLFDVSPQCFFPQPKVYSSVIKIEFKDNFLEFSNYLFFKEIVKLSFNQRRKILSNNLFKRLGLDDKTIANDEILFEFSSKRPEELSSNDFLNLTDVLVNNYPSICQNLLQKK